MSESIITNKDMAILKTEEIIKATGGDLLSDNGGSFAGVSIDSRTISEGEIFFALRGQKFDAHDFIGQAFLKGNGAVIDIKKNHLITEKPGVLKGKVIIHVKDTTRALQDLAHFLIARRNIPVIAVTGSNGKTTTKEMTYAILSKRFNVLKNEGNLNNLIGLPLTLTMLGPDDEVAVLELGMNAEGEIKRLCEIAVPSHGIITNIGLAHIGGLGGLDSVRDAKLEIMHGLKVAVLNADDRFLMEGCKAVIAQGGFEGRIITFSIYPVRKPGQGFLSNGINNDSHVIAKDVHVTEKGSDFILALSNGGSTLVSLNIHGLFNVYNALAASAVSISLGITLEEIKTALEGYTAFPMRFEVIKAGGITLINDSYNANPSSMEECLKELVRMRGKGRTVAVLGDMFELGEFSEKSHKTIGRIISDMSINVFVAVGDMMRFAAEESRSEYARNGKNRNNRPEDNPEPAIYYFKTIDEARQKIPEIIKEGDVVLVKGSHNMGMEKIVEAIKE